MKRLLKKALRFLLDLLDESSDPVTAHDIASDTLEQRFAEMEEQRRRDSSTFRFIFEDKVYFTWCMIPPSGVTYMEHSTLVRHYFYQLARLGATSLRMGAGGSRTIVLCNTDMPIEIDLNINPMDIVGVR